MRHRLHNAFTLIELLVVIAIIAILAAILFPVFAQAREKARGTSCLSNMKQIGTAVYMYTQDYDETYPRMDGCGKPSPNPLGSPAVGCDGTDGPCTGFTNWGQRLNHYKWPVWVLPYVKNVQIFTCPSRQRSETDWQCGGEIYNGYALNLSITGSTNTWNRSPTANGSFRNSFTGGGLAGLEAPAETFIVMEHWFPGVWSYVTPSAPTQTAYPLATREVWARALKIGTSVDKRAAPHSEGFNFAFCDGHAKFMSVDAFLAQCPPQSEYVTSSVPNPYPGGMTWTISAPPVWTRPWPLWGLR